MAHVFEYNITVGQDYNKYPNKFKSPQIHSNAMYCGKIKHKRMLFYHQNVSESIKTHQKESEAINALWN